MGSSLAVRAAGVWLFLATLLPAPGPAVASSAFGLSSRVSASAGVDTNPGRDFSQTGTRPDAVFSALASAQGSYVQDWFAATAELELGGRKFLLDGTEDTFVQSGAVELSARLASVLRAGLTGSGKQRLGGDRSYGDLAGLGYLAFAPDARVEVRAQAGAQRFVYWPDQTFSFGGTELGARARYRIDAHHQLFAEAGLSLRTFGGAARPRPALGQDPGLGRRQDSVIQTQLGYGFRGPVVFNASYAYFGDDSNSFGESLSRHRLTAQAAVRLPWRLTLLGQVSVQFTAYPDGVYLSPELQLLEDTESWNSVSAQLSRPLVGPLDLSVTWLLTFGQLTTNQLSYSRNLVTVGVSARFDVAPSGR